MDPTRFDALARSFASGSTRRRILAVLVALPLAGTLPQARLPAGGHWSQTAGAHH